MGCDKGRVVPDKNSTNEEIARVLHTSMRKIDRVKKRFVEEGLDVALNGRKGSRIYAKTAALLRTWKWLKDVYKRPIDPFYPVVCMDESPKQLIAETKVPIPASPGEVAKYDYEYRRCGVCNVFLACEPCGRKTHGQNHRKKNQGGLGLFYRRDRRSIRKCRPARMVPVPRQNGFVGLANGIAGRAGGKDNVSDG